MQKKLLKDDFLHIKNIKEQYLHKKKSIIAVVSFFILMFSFIGCTKNNHSKVKIKINEKIYSIEVADTSEKRQKGLMFRKKLSENSGMLFVYSFEDYRYFYMKNTLIPLDIAFLSGDKEIINIEQMQPLDETTIPSQGKAMFAIEMNKGFFEKNGIKIGDKVEILSPIKYNQ